MEKEIYVHVLDSKKYWGGGVFISKNKEEYKTIFSGTLNEFVVFVKKKMENEDQLDFTYIE